MKKRTYSTSSVTSVAVEAADQKIRYLTDDDLKELARALNWLSPRFDKEKAALRQRIEEILRWQVPLTEIHDCAPPPSGIATELSELKARLESVLDQPLSDFAHMEFHRHGNTNLADEFLQHMEYFVNETAIRIERLRRRKSRGPRQLDANREIVARLYALFDELHQHETCAKREFIHSERHRFTQLACEALPYPFELADDPLRER